MFASHHVCRTGVVHPDCVAISCILTTDNQVPPGPLRARGRRSRLQTLLVAGSWTRPPQALSSGRLCRGQPAARPYCDVTGMVSGGLILSKLVLSHLVRIDPVAALHRQLRAAQAGGALARRLVCHNVACR
jgi:hypothetical protein